MTPERLAEIERMLTEAKGATRGPLHAFRGPAEDDLSWSVCSQHGDCDKAQPRGTDDGPGCPDEPHCHRCLVFDGLTEGDARLIAAAPTVIAELVAEVHLLRAALARRVGCAGSQLQPSWHLEPHAVNCLSRPDRKMGEP